MQSKSIGCFTINATTSQDQIGMGGVGNGGGVEITE